MFWANRIDTALSTLSRRAPLPLRVVLWDGREVRLSERPRLTLHVRDPRAAEALAHPSLLTLAEAYVEGEIDFEGDLREAVRSAEAMAKGRSGALFGARGPTNRRHSRSTDREAIRRHYDVSNEFFALWLDPRMVYSCAYFRDPAMGLDEAQLAKLDHICRKLRLAPGDRFLDIGCGWGALVIHAAARYGVEATGITLSSSQFALATERIRAAGLSDRCRVLLQDYRDHSGEPYDKVASVGMFEHVGLRNLPKYFGAVERLLGAGGLFLNHGITTCDVDNRAVGLGAGDFIEKYVFPQGELPHLHRVVHDMSAAGFEVHDVEALRPHYAKTLGCWSERFESRFAQAAAASDGRTARVWRLYLAGCAHAFERGWVSVHQVLASRRVAGQRYPVPLTRDWMYRDG